MKRLGKPTTCIGLLLCSLIGIGHLGVNAYEVLGSTVAFFVASVALIPFHEAGHALLGWLVGIRVARVIVGHGRVLAQKRVGRVLWQLKLIPVGGVTVAAVPDRSGFPRLRLGLFILGGPLANLAVALLCWRWYGRLPSGGAGHFILDSIGTASVAQLIFNLLPLSMPGDGNPMKSDGYQLMTIPFMKRADLEQRYAGEYFLSAADEMEAGHHAEALAWVERGLERYPAAHALRQQRAMALYHLGRIDETLDELSALLAVQDDALKPLTLNNWAWFAFLRGDDRDLPLADWRSAEALALRPQLAALAGTRGTVLLWQGRVTEALPLLERSFERADTSAGRGANACLLATAYAALGRVGAAEKSLAAARTLKPDPPLLSGAEAAVAAARQREGQSWTLPALRGNRAVVVEEDALILVRGPNAARTRIAFDEIDQLRASLTARGQGFLAIEHAGGRWRMPLDPRALGAARLALAPAISAQPAPASSAIHRPAQRQRDLAAIGRALCTAAIIAYGSHGPVTSGDSLVIVMGLGMVGVLAPGPAPLVALGLSVCLEIAMGFLGVTDNPRDGGFWGGFWIAVWAAMGAGAAAVGWSMRNEAAEKRRRWRMPVVSIVVIAAFPSFTTVANAIAGNRPLTLHRLGEMSQALGALGVFLTALAAALWVSLEQGRWRSVLLALPGVAGLVLGSDWFHEATVLREWGPRPPGLTWSTKTAQPLRQIELPAGVWPMAISPGGTAWAARATDGPAASQYDPDDDDISPSKAAQARILIGDFAGETRAVPGFVARFLDDRAALVLAQDDIGRWQGRELLLADPTIPARVATVSGRSPPALFRDEPAGPVFVLEAHDRDEEADPPRRWTWSSRQGLSPASDFDRSRHVYHIDGDGRMIGTESGLLGCPGWLASGRLLCVAMDVHPLQLVAFDRDRRSHRRLASVAADRGRVQVLPGGRVAMMNRAELVVVDVVAGTATRLLLPPPAHKKSFERVLVAGGLAVATRTYGDSAAATRTTLAIFAAP